MGTSATPAQLTAKLQAAARELERAEEQAIRDAAQRGKAIMQASMGFTTMRGVGKSGGRVGVRYTIKGGSSPSVLLKYFGQVHLANNPTSAHEIKPKSGRRGKKALNIGGNPRASAQHPGTKGKRFHERSVPLVAKAAGNALQNQTQTALRKVF